VRMIDEGDLYMSVQFKINFSLIETHRMFKIQNLRTSLEQRPPCEGRVGVNMNA
jgi:hypothetical protein